MQGNACYSTWKRRQQSMINADVHQAQRRQEKWPQTNLFMIHTRHVPISSTTGVASWVRTQPWVIGSQYHTRHNNTRHIKQNKKETWKKRKNVRKGEKKREHTSRSSCLNTWTKTHTESRTRISSTLHVLIVRPKREKRERKREQKKIREKKGKKKKIRHHVRSSSPSTSTKIYTCAYQLWYVLVTRSTVVPYVLVLEPLPTYRMIVVHEAE